MKIDKKNKLKILSSSAAMADVAMLLLIFFMVTTTIVPTKSIEVNLPEGKAGAVDSENLYIGISNQGEIYIKDRKVKLNQLTQILATNDHQKAKKVVISADQDINFIYISKVLSTLRENDFLNVVFMTKPVNKN